MEYVAIRVRKMFRYVTTSMGRGHYVGRATGLISKGSSLNLLNSTQLNEPPTKVSGLQGKKLRAYSYPRSLKRQSSFLLKFSTVLQRKNAAGRLFHASTILTE